MAKQKKPEGKIVTTEEILLKLCHSVTGVLSEAAHIPVYYSPMAQKISKTCLRPDIGCFVLFDGAFSGLVVINLTAEAAMEIYHNYLSSMNIPDDEQAQVYTSDEVGNVMGELMNQILGDFTKKVSQELKSSITQSQPKMLTLNRQVRISVDTNLDHPQARRVSFYTGNNNILYMELAMDHTEFIKLQDFDAGEEVNPDDLIESYSNGGSPEGAPADSGSGSAPAAGDDAGASTQSDADDLLASLGL